MDEFMTIYYRKANGEIKSIMSGSCDMNVFGDEKEDYMLIWDYIVIEYDEYVRFNWKQFKVNLETKSLVYIAPSSVVKYETVYE